MTVTEHHAEQVAALHVDQIRRYEAGSAQTPSNALIGWLKLCIGVVDLGLDESEHGPSENLRLQFEAVSQLSPEEPQTVRELLEGLILKHEAHR